MSLHDSSTYFTASIIPESADVYNALREEDEQLVV